jgi:hypothetical protein
MNKHEEALDKVKNIILSEEDKIFVDLSAENTDEADYNCKLRTKMRNLVSSWNKYS